MKFVTHQTTLHLSFKIKCCVDRLRPPPNNRHYSAALFHGSASRCQQIAHRTILPISTPGSADASSHTPSRRLGNILAVSNLEAGPVARLYSLWYEQNAFNDRFSVRIGLMSADSQFLQSKTAANFINIGISWPTFLAGNLPASGPAYPLPDPGIRVRFKAADDVSFQAAVFSGDPR